MLTELVPDKLMEVDLTRRQRTNQPLLLVRWKYTTLNSPIQRPTPHSYLFREHTEFLTSGEASSSWLGHCQWLPFVSGEKSAKQSDIHRRKREKNLGRKPLPEHSLDTISVIEFGICVVSVRP